MASIYQLKSRFQGLLRPLVQFLFRIGATANQVTLAAVILSLLEGVAMVAWKGCAWPFLLLPVVLFIRMALNAIDGMLAREHQQQSKLGAVLNELGDVFADIFLYLPFALISAVSSTLVVAIVILAIVSEMTGVVAVQIGASRRYDGPLGKSDRAFLFGALGLIIGLHISLTLWGNVVLGLAVLLLVITIINRARKALLETQHAK